MERKAEDRAVSRIGLRKQNAQGCWMEIISYRTSADVTVKFDQPYACEVKCQFSWFSKGNLENPMFPSVYGAGYLGIGRYSTSVHKKIYNVWHGMMARCYHPHSSIYFRYGAKGVRVCDGWHNFQEFAEWFDTHSYDIGGEKLHVDKDMFGQMLYGPDSCVIVPMIVNTMLFKNDAVASGVRQHESGRFSARVVLPETGRVTMVGRGFETYDEAQACAFQSKAVTLHKLAYSYDLPDEVKSVIDKYCASLCAGRRNIAEFDEMGPGKFSCTLDEATDRLEAFLYARDLPARRLGERRIQNCGAIGEIAAYRKENDIDVRFDSGFMAEHCKYGNFVRGMIYDPNSCDHTGERHRQNCGMDAWVVTHRDYQDVDVMFEDGTVVYHRRMSDLREGKIQNPNLPNWNERQRADADILGTKVVNRRGETGTVIRDEGCEDVYVKFLDGTIGGPYRRRHVMNGRFGKPAVHDVKYATEAGLMRPSRRSSCLSRHPVP